MTRSVSHFGAPQCRRGERGPLNEARQLSWPSAFQPDSGCLLVSALGASASACCLCHATEHAVRQVDSMRRASIHIPAGIASSSLTDSIEYGLRAHSCESAGPPLSMRGPWTSRRTAGTSMPSASSTSRDSIRRMLEPGSELALDDPLETGLSAGSGMRGSPLSPDPWNGSE